MMFSKACEYGIKGVLYIASKSFEGNRVKVGDIVEHTQIPAAFTGKILGLLSRNGIINSYTGPNGGFDMNDDQMKTTALADIVTAIDGDTLFYGCALGLSECNETEPCPMHDSFAAIRDKLKDTLKATTVFDLAVGLKKGEFLLMR